MAMLDPNNTRNHTSSTLRYPLEDQERYGGQITFTKYRTEGANVSDGAGVAAEVWNRTGDALSFFGEKLGIVTREGPPGGSGGENVRLAFENSIAPSPAPPNKTVIDYSGQDGAFCTMYLPAEITLADAQNYANVDMGIFGSLMERGLAGGAGVAGGFGAGLAQMTASLYDFFTGNGTDDTLNVAAARFTSFAPEGVSAGIRTALQVTPNPNLRAIFQGVGLRQFNVTFEMMPKSRAETDEIKRIIRYFRSGSYPESKRIAGISAGYVMPTKFGIGLKYVTPTNENPLAVKFKKCYLRSVNMTYNGQNMAFVEDNLGRGDFARYGMVLDFVEEQTIDKQDVERHDF